MLLATLFGSTIALAGLPPMSIVGTKTLPQMRFSHIALPMMMAPLAILDAPWHIVSMLASIAPKPLPVE